MKQKLNINYFRAAACMAVVFVHLGQQITLPNQIQKIFDFGSSGVMVFFILTGYLSFLSFEKYKSCNIGFAKWVIKHLVRILPVYYVIIVFYMVYFGLVLKQVPQDNMGIGWLRYIFCINQLLPAVDGFWTNLGGTWTISIFIIFYLLVPILYKVIKNYKQAIVFFIVSYLGARLLDGFTDWFRALNFIYYFAIGIIIYYVLKEKKENHWTILALSGLVVMLAMDSAGGLKLGLIISVMIVQSIEFPGSKKKIEVLINIISKYSYSIYLVHLSVISVISNLNLTNNFKVIVLFSLATVILSWCMYQFVEKPFSIIMGKNIIRYYN